MSFPVAADELEYPDHGHTGSENPFYLTSNRDYGRNKPTQFEVPTKYKPINNKFTRAFVAERVPDTTLNTFLTPSRVHQLFDS